MNNDGLDFLIKEIEKRGGWLDDLERLFLQEVKRKMGAGEKIPLREQNRIESIYRRTQSCDGHQTKQRI